MNSILDLRKLSLEDIKLIKDQEEVAYQKLVINHKLSAIEKPMDIRVKRRYIAKVNTVITEKKSS